MEQAPLVSAAPGGGAVTRVSETLLAGSDETRSGLVLTSKRPLAQWTNVMPDATSATAILARHLHQADAVEHNGRIVPIRQGPIIRLATGGNTRGHGWGTVWTLIDNNQPRTMGAALAMTLFSVPIYIAGAFLLGYGFGLRQSVLLISVGALLIAAGLCLRVFGQRWRRQASNRSTPYTTGEQ